MKKKVVEFNLQINEIPIDRLTLQDAQRLIDKAKEQLILYTKRNKFHNSQESTSSYKHLQSDYTQHMFERSKINHPDFIRPR